jgi:predicted kinase
MLIGPPGSGKSTLAQQMHHHLSRSCIVATDRIRHDLYGDESYQGIWADIEAIALQQIQAAVDQGIAVIYDATNAQRPWRMAFLSALSDRVPHWIGWHLTTPLKTCHQWNRRRDRAVPKAIIDSSYQMLQQFPPLTAEGFLAVYPIDPHQPMAQVEKRLKTLSRSITNRANRTQHRQVTFHSYSALLDFDRLMHLISLLARYPGLGQLHKTNPAQMQRLLNHQPIAIAHTWDELSAVLAEQCGQIYGDPEAIRRDLAWLEAHGFLSPTPITTPLHQPLRMDPQIQDGLSPHSYSDWEPFQRLLLMVRFITHHPFCWDPEQPKSLVGLMQAMQRQGLLLGESEAALRKDVEQVLKPFGILPPFRLRRGYFIGTGILSESELLKMAGVLQGQAKTIQDPIALSLLDLLRDRLQRSQHDLDPIYPVRAIANRMIIDPDQLPSDALARHPDRLDAAIEAGHCLEIQRYAGTGRFETDQSHEFMRVWPLQIVFHNIAWYLGYEIAEGDRQGLLQFERLDRLFLGRELSMPPRSRSIQVKLLHRLHALQQASGGLFLGSDPQVQRQFLSRDPAVRALVSLQMELWFTDRIFAFVSEGTQRFPTEAMKLSPRDRRQAAQQPHLFCLPQSQDPQYPHCFQVDLPIWAVDDIDLRRWILGFGADVKIIEPESLRSRIYQMGQEIAALYAPETGDRPPKKPR